MKRTVRSGLALLFLLLCAALLTACGSKGTQEVSGLVTEIQTGADGSLTAFVVQNGDGTETGILLTEETHAFPPGGGSWTFEEMREAFQAALQPDRKVEADCAWSKKAMTTGSGARITAYEARYIRITGQLSRGAATLRDGTSVDVLEDSGPFSGHTYLKNGTELLRVRAPSGPESSYVAGVESFADLSGTAQERVSAYYDERGLLYDEAQELEKTYACYQRQGADFRSRLVEQTVAPTASSGRVMYFLTTVTLPVDSESSATVYEKRLGDAFDRETGAHIHTWELFTAPKETVIRTLLDKSGITDQPLRAEMEAASWEGHIIIFPDSMEVWFESGTLPSQTSAYGLLFDYDQGGLGDLMQSWAVPNSQG